MSALRRRKLLSSSRGLLWGVASMAKIDPGLNQVWVLLISWGNCYVSWPNCYIQEAQTIVNQVLPPFESLVCWLA